MTASTARKETVVELGAKDLNANGGIFCPSPKADMQLWNTHPRVYLPIEATKEARCPYCGTVYKLAGAAPSGH